jgi:hypothetical protein
MKNGKRLPVTNLNAMILIAVILILIAGCDNDPMSPCNDCTPSGENGTFTSVVEHSFAVGDAATVMVNNFVGQVTCRTGEAGAILVRATRRAAYRSDLDRIEVDMAVHQGDLNIVTANPEDLRNVSVDLLIIAPPGTCTRLSTGVGNIRYQGRPEGACHFTTGVGSVILRLRADANIMVNLRTGIGSIYLGLPVVGPVATSPAFVEGRIGSGDEGSAHARTGIGNIFLMRQ